MHPEQLESASQDDTEQESAGGAAICGKGRPGSWNSTYEERPKIPDLSGGIELGGRIIGHRLHGYLIRGEHDTHVRAHTAAVSLFHTCFLP